MSCNVGLVHTWAQPRWLHHTKLRCCIVNQAAFLCDTNGVSGLSVSDDSELW